MSMRTERADYCHPNTCCCSILPQISNYKFLAGSPVVRIIPSSDWIRLVFGCPLHSAGVFEVLAPNEAFCPRGFPRGDRGDLTLRLV
jgi:hypothetical protein